MITDSLMTMLFSLFFSHWMFLIFCSFLALIFDALKQAKFFVPVILISAVLMILGSKGVIPEFQFYFLSHKFDFSRLDFETMLLSSCFLLCFFCQILFYQDSNKPKLINPVTGLICGFSLAALSSNLLLISVAFIELIAIFSTILIFSEISKRSFNLGMRYMIIHVISSSMLVAGVAIEFSQGDSGVAGQMIMLSDFANIGDLSLNKIAQCLMLMALLIDCATFPFSNWLVDSYSSTHPYIAATISTYATKIVIYLTAKLFLGCDLLLYLGLISMLYSGILSLATGNLRQIISYNMINKFGLLLVLIGIGGSIMSMLLAYLIAYFMISGLVLFFAIGKMNLSHGTCALNEVLFYDKKSVAFLLIGILSSISFPLTGGYGAKLLIKQFLMLNPYIYVAVTILLISQLLAMCKMLLPYLRYQDLLHQENEGWTKSELLSLVILSLFIVLSNVLFQKIFYLQFDFFALFSDSHALVDYFISLGLVVGFLYLMRRFLVRNNLELLDVDWIVRTLLYKLVECVVLVEKWIENKILTLIAYSVSILPLRRIGIMNQNYSLIFVIDGFVLSLFVLFVILFL